MHGDIAAGDDCHLERFVIYVGIILSRSQNLETYIAPVLGNQKVQQKNAHVPKLWIAL